MILFIKTLKREQQQQRVQATILTIKIYQLVLHCKRAKNGSEGECLQKRERFSDSGVNIQ